MNWSSDPAPDTDFARREAALTALKSAASQRILIIDADLRYQIQCLNLDDKNFRGDRFHSCDRLLQGNNDLLTLTQPQAIEDIHLAYALAGADILETNTFSSTFDRASRLWDGGSGLPSSIATGRDWRTRRRSRRKGGRRLLRRRSVGADEPNRSLSPDVNNPGFRAVSFDELRIAYGEQIGTHRRRRGHPLIETIFDTAERQGCDLRLLRGLH